MTIETLYSIFQEYPSVQTDTRKLKSGEIFFALKGPNFNANELANQALEMGAPFAIADEIAGTKSERIILVDNVLTTLQQLALYHRKQFKIPFLAITGSNGKTTTKELIHAVLSSSKKTYTTQGNLNNHIGVPLTILGIKKDAELAVIEMGANHLKEIESYCKIALPTHGIITNCGKAHLEGFGSIEGVRKGKGELYDFLKGNKGTAFVMWDYDYLREMSSGIPHIISYGTQDADITATALQSEPFLKASIANGPSIVTINTQLVGDYNLPNVLAAIAVGDYFKVPFPKIRQAIENYSPSNSRSQLVQKNGNQIILDAYNANPSSMKVAIENFAKQDHPNKLIFLGAMMELGKESLNEHVNIVQMLQQYPWKEVVLVGGDFGNISHPFRYFPGSSEAKEWLHKNIPEKSLLLIKGSRSMKMETLMEAFE
jgi:UDP-N-acetylmuramoyl-tripeptide--D-alanyl-D-alanine ligase